MLMMKNVAAAAAGVGGERDKRRSRANRRQSTVAVH